MLGATGLGTAVKVPDWVAGAHTASCPVVLMVYDKVSVNVPVAVMVWASASVVKV